MLTPFFLTINDWITSATYLAGLGCFLWGMVSVLFSPCHLASIPLVVAYVAGQDNVLKPRQAAHYALLFTVGLFITIAAIGVICALLGRMLGDVGSYWQIAVGLVLIWVAPGSWGWRSATSPAAGCTG
ncbi:MAG: cytochrome c biogenesis protein CcdA [Syntrophobacterales bacterium]|nr:cytochrome c biogenesis protein CcdA [Syntrophobacterales bacterium]